MKKLSITDSYFDEVIGGISRRAIANALISGRTVFPSKYKVFFSKIQNWTLMLIIIAMTAVSTWIVAGWVMPEKERKIVLQEIYHSNERVAKEKKAGLYEKYNIAGAGDNTRQSK